MLRAIQGMLGVRQPQTRPQEHERLLGELQGARKRWEGARRHYDSLMECVVWTPEEDRRIELAHHELKTAEEHLAYMTAFARGAGVRVTWEDVLV